mgnify:CR=1 FL=1
MIKKDETLTLKQLGIDTYKEAVVFMKKDSHTANGYEDASFPLGISVALKGLKHMPDWVKKGAGAFYCLCRVGW